MNQCKGPEYQKMMHAWELDLLSEKERQVFEQHLMGCQSCADEISQFRSTVATLKQSTKAQRRVAQLDKADSIDRQASSLRPARILAIAALLIVSVLSVYFVLPGDQTTAQVQQLDLLPVRSSTVPIVDSEKLGDVIIRFVYEEAEPGSAYNVSIIGRSGSVVFGDSEFVDFSDSGLGLITLPITDFDLGHHIMTISDPMGKLTDQEYHFLVE